MTLRATALDARQRSERVPKPLVSPFTMQAHPLHSPTHMTEQQNRKVRRTREEPLSQSAGAVDARSRKAVEDRNAAVRRWIDEDDDSCCRGID